MLGLFRKFRINKLEKEYKKYIASDGIIIEEIYDLPSIKRLFRIEIVQKRKVLISNDKEPFVMIKSKNNVLQIGHGTEYNNNKPYFEIRLDLGTPPGMHPNSEVLGVEQYFIFREFSPWDRGRLDIYLQLASETMILVNESKMRFKLIERFENYKAKVNSLELPYI